MHSNAPHDIWGHIWPSSHMKIDNLSWRGQGFRLPRKLEYQKQGNVVCKIQLAQLDAEQGFYNGKMAVKLRVV